MAIKNFLLPASIILSIFFSSYVLAAENEKLSSLIQKRKDGILTLMGFTVFPDATTSSLSINNAQSDNTHLQQTTVGGGFELDSSNYPYKSDI